MSIIKIATIRSAAKTLQASQNMSYEQALEVVAKEHNFNTYDQLLESVKIEYIFDEDEQISEFKLNVFNNRDEIEACFIELEKLQKEYNQILVGDKYDDNEDLRNELLDKIEHESCFEISKKIAELFFCGIYCKATDNGLMYVERPAFAAYATVSYQKAFNDLNGNQADYCIELNIKEHSFEFYTHSYEIINYDKTSFSHDGETETVEVEDLDWTDWSDGFEIVLP